MITWMKWDPHDNLYFTVYRFFFFDLGVGPILATIVFMDWMIKSTARGVWTKGLANHNKRMEDLGKNEEKKNKAM